MQPCADEIFVAIAHRGDCARPEDLAHDGSVVQQRFAVGRERVEASRDQCLDVVGHGDLVVTQLTLLREHPSVTQHPDELLGVERIASGSLQEHSLRLRREDRLLQERGE